MAKINLTALEKRWLNERIQHRLASFKDLSGFSKHTKLLNGLLGKLKTDALQFTPYEAAICCGCINELMPELTAGIKVENALSLVRAEPAEIAQLRCIDAANDLLEKLGYFKRAYDQKPTSYQSYLTAIAKLRDAKHVCLSLSDLEVYKIGLVCGDGTVLTWEMRDTLEPRDLRFTERRGAALAAYEHSFMRVASVAAAAQLLERPLSAIYDRQTQQFFTTILN